MIGDPLLRNAPEIEHDQQVSDTSGSMLSRVPWEAIQLGFAVSSLVTILIALKDRSTASQHEILVDTALTLGQIGLSGLAGVASKKF